MMKPPPRWSSEELSQQLARSVAIFKRERLEEPLEAYLEHFETYQSRVEEIVEATVDLTQLRSIATEILTNPQLLEVFRYLSGPPISTDDLKILSDTTSFAAKRLHSDYDLVERVVDTVMTGLDRRRFPWIAEGREPDEAERHAAIVATTALMATQRLGTNRRSQGKSLQEGQVEDALLQSGYVKVPRRIVATSADMPGPGEFCGESKLGSRKADFIVRLWDYRAMPIECKVSNSATNSVKRLNNDAAAKAEAWRRDFGETQVVPCAVLSGVYKVHNLEDAQRRGLTLFWAHQLDAMLEWIASTRPPQRT
jgi:hypothetical protein